MQKNKAKQDTNRDDDTERLQKVMAYAGVASRRASEAIIQAGRVTVNGQVVTELGTKVNPLHDEIKVDGQPIGKTTEKLVYIILNKPVDVLSSASDDRGRQTVIDLVKVRERLYPVGRLDLRSEGLMLLTNDGELTKQLTHPSHDVEKEYHALVVGRVTTDKLEQWRRGGIEVAGRPLAEATVERIGEQGRDTWLKIVLTEGRKRQIREVAAALRLHVKQLRRVRIGPIKLGKLEPGKWRHLTPAEVRQLQRAAR